MNHQNYRNVIFLFDINFLQCWRCNALLMFDRSLPSLFFKPHVLYTKPSLCWWFNLSTSWNERMVIKLKCKFERVVIRMEIHLWFWFFTEFVFPLFANWKRWRLTFRLSAGNEDAKTKLNLLVSCILSHKNLFKLINLKENSWDY